MIRRDLVLIGLSPTGLRVACVSRGSLRHVERVTLDPAQWGDAWANNLRPLESPLAGALAAVGVHGKVPARVAYLAPATIVDFTSVPLRGSKALHAARVALRESLTDPDARIMAVHPLAVESSGTGEAARTHVVLTGETVAQAEILAAWLDRAGLMVESLVPTRALLARVAMREAAELPAEGAHALVWLDDHVTVLIARAGGRTQFVRALDLGYAQLSGALVRASSATGSPMDPATAYRLLTTVGVPRRGTVIDPSSGLKAESVLPLMQTVLQRYLVETKQTLRFGLPEGELARATVHLHGPGAAIPGVGEAFAGGLDWGVNRADLREEPLADQGRFDEAQGELVHLIGPLHRGIGVLAPSESARRAERACVRAVRVGVAAGLALLAGFWWDARRKMEVLEAQAALLEPRTELIRSAREARERAVALNEELAAAQRIAQQTFPPRPDWKGVLGELSHVAGPAIELSEVLCTPGRDTVASSVLTVRGTAWARDEARSADDVLGGFLERLSKSPLVESARVLSSRTEVAAGRDVKQFSVAATLRTVPVAMPGVQRTASAGGEP
jgi:hypothetical protein